MSKNHYLNSIIKKLKGLKKPVVKTLLEFRKQIFLTVIGSIIGFMGTYISGYWNDDITVEIIKDKLIVFNNTDQEIVFKLIGVEVLDWERKHFPEATKTFLNESLFSDIIPVQNHSSTNVFVKIGPKTSESVPLSFRALFFINNIFRYKQLNQMVFIYLKKGKEHRFEVFLKDLYSLRESTPLSYERIYDKKSSFYKEKIVDSLVRNIFLMEESFGINGFKLSENIEIDTKDSDKVIEFKQAYRMVLHDLENKDKLSFDKHLFVLMGIEYKEILSEEEFVSIITVLNKKNVFLEAKLFR